MALDIVKQIKDTILGVKSNKIDTLIDDSLTRMDKFTASEDKNKYLESMKKLISSVGADDNSVLKSLSTGSPQVQTYDNSGRIARYQEYDSICEKIPYCARALECWVDHIVSPDEILKNSLQITSFDKDNQSDEVTKAIGRLNTLVKHFDFDNRIRDIIRVTLKKGDNFIELVKTPGGTNTLVVLNEGLDAAAYTDSKVITTSKYLVESADPNVKPRKVKITVDESVTGFSFGGMFTGLNTNVTSPSNSYITTTATDISGLVDNAKSKDKTPVGSTDDDFVPYDKFKKKFDEKEEEARRHNPKEEPLRIGDLSIVVHDPKYVIRLETRRFKVCLGYLVFPKVDVITMNTGAVNNIDAICAELLSNVYQKLTLKSNDDKIYVSDDIRKVLAAHLQHIAKNDDLKIRYVNPDLMQHFKLTSTKYDPYGQSIFDPVLFSCRMYIAQQTATVVKQINACTDKRFISLEIGLPRDAKNVIEKMKETLNKKRITVDSLGNTDTIPSQISTWENIFIPMKEGKKYVEIDHQQWNPSANEDVDALKNAVNNIVGNLGVPASYLNLDEGAGNRAVLTAESINFCRCIISRQQELTPCLRQFFYKAYCIVWGTKEADILKKIQITFQMPRIAPMNINIEYIENSQRAIDALANLGINKEYLKREYMPYIDWDKVNEDSVKQKLNQETGEEAPTDDGMGGMGGMGMMPTGGGMGMGGMM